MSENKEPAYAARLTRAGEIISEERFAGGDPRTHGRAALDVAVQWAKEHGWTPITAVTPSGPQLRDEEHLRANLIAGCGYQLGDVRVSVVRYNLGYGSF